MTSYWGVRVGPGGKYAEVAHKHGFVAIAWHELGDLVWFAEAKDGEAAFKKLLKEYQDVNNATGLKASIGAGQVRRFVREIQDGDIVFLPNTAKRRMYVGRVKGGYSYVQNPADGCPYRQRRNVKWLLDVSRDELPQRLLNSLGGLATVFSIQKRADLAKAVVEGGTSPKKDKRAKDVIEHVRDQLMVMHPKAFEAFVASYFSAIGYDAEPTPYVGDGGIDVAGTLNAEGLAEVLLRVQVKRTKANVGIETVLKTRGALAVDEQGAIVSLGGFTPPAQAEAEAAGKKTIILVDGRSFVEMVLDHWEDLEPTTQQMLGVSPKERLPVQERFAVADRGNEPEPTKAI